MGIKDYLKYLKQECVSGIIGYEHVYIDCNYMIHFLIYKCKNDKDLYDKIYYWIDDLMHTIKIKSTIQLFYDGEYENESEQNPKFQTHQIRYKNKLESEDYDKQIIKPLSQILKKFKYYLLDIIEKYKKINKEKFEIIINSDEIKGEADIKILNSIYYSDQNKILICSKDSDMILIAHSLSVCKSIKIDVMSNFRPIQIINNNDFKKYNKDYVLMVLLLGNDYLPKISNISYNNLLYAYEKYIMHNKPIIADKNINKNNLIEFITYFILSSKKKIKYNYENLNFDKFTVYINNLFWCLKLYKVVVNDLKYIQPENNNTSDTNTTNSSDCSSDKKKKNTINIYNFIYYNYDDMKDKIFI